MRSRIYKIFAGLSISGLLVGGGVVDKKIDPYIQSDQDFSIVANSTVNGAGRNKISLTKGKPEIKLSKWNEEVSLGVDYTDVKGQGSRKLFTDKIEWKDAKKEVHAYPLEAKAGMEDGGFEIEVVLNEKPDTNVFPFTITGAENLDFFYQPALTQAEIAEGAFRPDNVVGSYAVYHKEKANHVVGQTNYATGKAYHIYRPKAIDANGVETWAQLNYSDGVLTVTVPQNYLNTAAYPVVVDPTLGYTSVGASTNTSCADAFNNANRIGNPYTLSEDGTLDSLSIHFSVSANDAVDVASFVNQKDSVSANSHGQIANVITANVNITTTPTWFTFNFSNQAITNGNNYIPNAVCDGSDVSVGAVAVLSYFDTPGGAYTTYTESGLGAYATLSTESPWTVSDSSDVRFSIYATYTASGEATTNGSVKLNGGTLQLNGGTYKNN